MAFPRFQFRLRTLLVGMALAGVFCGYIAGEAKIVRERKAWLTPNREMAMFFMYQGPSPPPNRFGDHDQQPSQVRLWLGDEPHFNLAFESSTSAAEIAAAMALFPEADVCIVPAIPESGGDARPGQ